MPTSGDARSISARISAPSNSASPPRGRRDRPVRFPRRLQARCGGSASSLGLGAPVVRVDEIALEMGGEDTRRAWGRRLAGLPHLIEHGAKTLRRAGHGGRAERGDAIARQPRRDRGDRVAVRPVVERVHAVDAVDVDVDEAGNDVVPVEGKRRLAVAARRRIGADFDDDAFVDDERAGDRMRSGNTSAAPDRTIIVTPASFAAPVGIDLQLAAFERQRHRIDRVLADGTTIDRSAGAAPQAAARRAPESPARRRFRRVETGDRRGSRGRASRGSAAAARRADSASHRTRDAVRPLRARTRRPSRDVSRM